ncbi:MAG: glucodextranase DOMON-like domain-containing protein [Desulfurococcaceae archaeon TW002]
MRRKALLLVLISLVITSVFTTPLTLIRAESRPLNVIIVWHYHQPWYYGENDSYFILPWVRMHSVGNYYKMALILSKYPEVKATFTFSGSLLHQLISGVNGVMDVRQVISWKIANGTATTRELFEMLRIPGGFFDINWANILELSPRFKELRSKAQAALTKHAGLPEEEMINKVVNEFTNQDFIDLATLFNLLWIDPEVVSSEYPELSPLRERALNLTNPSFTKNELALVLSKHVEIMSKIIPKYKDLINSGQVELIPVPYSHPIAPLLADLGWYEDLELHVKKALKLFETHFNYIPKGIWPAEQAVNEEALRIFSKYGISWCVTDRNVLELSGVNVTKPENYLMPWRIDFGATSFYVFFRDPDLSNRLGFQYSGMDTSAAINDFKNYLMSLASANTDKSRVVVIALDGENPWEHYRNFGDDFLNSLYATLKELQEQGIVVTRTPSEYLNLYKERSPQLPLTTQKYLDLAGKDISHITTYESLPTRELPARIAESSWSGKDARLNTWIGDKQENIALMWLVKARNDVMIKHGVTSIHELAEINPSAAEAILRAEASDWNWWYGGEWGPVGRFDLVYKYYLTEAYRSSGLQPPPYLNATFLPDGVPSGLINAQPPPSLRTKPKNYVIPDSELDRVLEVVVAHEVLDKVILGVDDEYLYVNFRINLTTNSNYSVVLYLSNPRRSYSPWVRGYNAYPMNATRDLGVAIANAVVIKITRESLVDPYSRVVVIYQAGGDESYYPSYVNYYNMLLEDGKVFVALGIKWIDLGLEVGDVTYLAVALYSGGVLRAYSSRLGSVYFVRVPRPPVAPGANIMAEFTDPEKDDKGTGTYVYPLNNVFVPGVFDLLKFSVLDIGEKYLLTFEVRELGGNPWGGPNGFSMQFFHIYVDTDNVPGSGNVTTLGLWVNVDPEYGWETALLVGPGWPGGNNVIYPNGTNIANVMSIYVEQPNKIIAEVPKQLIPAIKPPDEWGWVVVLTSWDGYGTNNIRSFSIDPAEWSFGVGAQHAIGVAAGVIPRIVDLLAPTPELQYSMLSSYSVDVETLKGTPAKIKGIRPAAQLPQPQTTITITTTETLSTTFTQIETTTVPQTITDWNLVTLSVVTTLIISVIVFLVLLRVFFKKK